LSLSKPNILVITPVKHVVGVSSILEGIGLVTYLDDPDLSEILKIVDKYDVIFTNPNKSKIYIGKELIDSATNLKVICTASTGTNHIDKVYAAEKNLPILSITEERKVINKISSTAEHAFGLTLAGLRHVVRSHNAVLKGEWDCARYIGRQMNYLTIGVIGYGRLGSMYSDYCKAFGAKVIVYDPYKKAKQSFKQVDKISELLNQSDVLAIHVHVTEETQNMFDKSLFNQMKSDVLLVNTSRGDIVNENDAVIFLKNNPQARIATDVLSDEIRNRLSSPLLKFAHESDQVIITPHIGGVSREAQEIGYTHAAKLLQSYFISN